MNRIKIEQLLEKTHHPDVKTRRRALLSLCPCHVRANSPEVWDRFLEMRDDSDTGVRSLVFHALCDGSPASRREEIVAAVKELLKDPNRRLRRRARGVIAAYRRTGNINQL